VEHDEALRLLHGLVEASVPSIVQVGREFYEVDDDTDAFTLRHIATRIEVITKRGPNSVFVFTLTQAWPIIESAPLTPPDHELVSS
jgi:hypothetical protein